MNPLLLIDFYKACHKEQYPLGITKLVSYYTPRVSRLEDVDKVTFFGLQGFIKTYLINAFNNEFFLKEEDEVVKEYERVLNATLGKGTYSTNKIRALHKLGYLPLEIWAVPEGSRTNIGVPQIQITNTHPDFAWLVNTIETMLSCYMWHIQVSAEVGYRYRQIVEHYHNITCDEDIPAHSLISDFSMRGQQSVESAMKSSAGWLLSFSGTATIPAILWLEDNYNCKANEELVGRGGVSTEHSVMCSNFAVDKNEIKQIKRLLTEIYPNNNFSMVSDSYDYWNLVEHILPQCKEEILNHNGWIGIRGDSGNPVEVVTRTVFKLWEIFGGSVNSKGYKVLNPHVKAIYGDSITPQRAKQIYEILKSQGFAINNVLLGAGSFSMMCLTTTDVMGNKHFNPYTRDTFGIAVKATYAEVGDTKHFIYKAPKGVKWKKSHKGCVSVCCENNEWRYTDGLYWEDVIVLQRNGENNFIPIYKEGIFLKEYSLQEVRNNLYKGEF